MTTWFGSDFHLGHKNVIDFCNRHFDTIENMNTFFIERYKYLVKPGDSVYLLGDIQFKGNFLEELCDVKADVHLVAGNHDPKK